MTEELLSHNKHTNTQVITLFKWIHNLLKASSCLPTSSTMVSGDCFVGERHNVVQTSPFWIKGQDYKTLQDDKTENEMLMPHNDKHLSTIVRFIDCGWMGQQ